MPKSPDIVAVRFGRFLQDLNNNGYNGNPPMSQEEIAEKFETSQAAINNYMHLKNSTISSTLILIAVTRFRANPWYFFGPYHDERKWHEFPMEEERIPNNELMALESMCGEALKLIKSARNRGNLRPIPKPRKGF